MIRTLFAAIAVLLLLVSCQPPPSGDELTDSSCVPMDLNVETNYEAMTVSWKAGCQSLIEGYNIYVSEQPLFESFGKGQLPKSVKAYNDNPFPGDTDLEDGIEYFEVKGMENGKKYYVTVRTVMPGGLLSASSVETEVVCGPKGEFVLSIRYKGEQDGWSFDKNGYTRADQSDNDLYYFSKEGEDFLTTPTKLNGFIRDSRFVVLAEKGEYDKIKKVANKYRSKAIEKSVDVSAGDWVLVTTADSKIALVKVLGFAGTKESRTIKLFYAYSTIKGEFAF